MQDLQHLIEEAKPEINAAEDSLSLEQVRVKYLGKKGVLTELLKEVGQLSASERPQAGQAVNKVKNQLQELLQQRRDNIESAFVQQQLLANTLDVTLPGRRQKIGNLHPITQVMQRIENFFLKLGYHIAEGPEIENEYYNFESLNMPSHHPARAMHDTFYFADGTLLRTHTSPVQIRVLEQSSPPIKIIAPGRVYRCDSDVTHTPMFHQVEGLVIDENASFADLKGLLQCFLNDLFEREIKMRFRPSYFPFTEPSAEVDIGCVICNGKGCRVCKQSGWLEILGCGMVHTNVLEMAKVDTEKFQGFAFGIGVDRLAMLMFEIDDLRTLFENDIRFLGQF